VKHTFGEITRLRQNVAAARCFQININELRNNRGWRRHRLKFNNWIRMDVTG
jgi:hypothetical protein